MNSNIKPHILVLLTFLLLGGMIVSPVSAVEYHTAAFPSYNQTSTYGEAVTSFDFNAGERNQAIGLIYIKVNHGSRVDFTLYYGNDSSVSGYTASELLSGWDLLRANTTVSLNGVSDSYSYLALNRFYDTEVAGYAKDSNTTPNSGFILSSDKYGLGDNDLAVFYVVPQIKRNLIYRVTATATGDPFNIEVVSGDVSDVAAFADRSAWQTVQDWLDFAWDIGGGLFAFVTLLFAIIKFFFWDNFLLVIILYLSVSMAYSAISTRNIFQFYKKFFGFQRSMLGFIVELWNYLIQIVSAFRGIFRI